MLLAAHPGGRLQNRHDLIRCALAGEELIHKRAALVPGLPGTQAQGVLDA
jgi:hypothetical protein